MKVKFCQDESLNEVEIIVRARELDDEVMGIIAKLKVDSASILGSIDKEYFVLELKNILYFESVDKKTYAYTLDQIYAVDKRLYELEEVFYYLYFQRCSKSMIVNLKQVKSIKSMLNSTLSILMENGERVEVSRQYAKIIKERLV